MFPSLKKAGFPKYIEKTGFPKYIWEKTILGKLFGNLLINKNA